MGEKKNKILVVDDDPFISRVLSRWLTREGFECATAARTGEALGLLEQESFALVVADITMPGRSGMELLTLTRERYPDVAVIMATAVDDRDTAIRALELGAYGYVIKPLDQNEVIINVANALERRRLVLESQQYQQRLEEEVRERTSDIRHREEEIALRLVAAAEYRDESTGAHIRRIGLYSAVLAEASGWDRQLVDDIRVAATMHDIGKIGVPDHILLKPGKLTLEEFEVVRKHPEIGAGILEGSKAPLLQLAREIALSHHEKWDGSGYPRGLAGEAIPQSGRVVAIVDAYDALVHNRVYRPAVPENKALAIMAEDQGKHFDPKLFEYFLSALPSFHNIEEQVL
jgi:putative two-component system response regulator